MQPAFLQGPCSPGGNRTWGVIATKPEANTVHHKTAIFCRGRHKLRGRRCSHAMANRKFKLLVTTVFENLLGNARPDECTESNKAVALLLHHYQDG